MSTSTSDESVRSIVLRGVRTHNLKNLDLDIPLRRIVAVTGVSGAGKSSLAIDTLFAEGQRRYVETFSPNTRQFLAKLDKPDADRIDGIPPAIALAQPRGRNSARSTVGTITEIHDALGLLYTRSGQVVCRHCGELVVPASPAIVAQAILAWPDGTRYEIAFPIDIRSQTDRATLTQSLRAQGFTRLRIDGQPVVFDGVDLVLPDNAVIDGIVDRLVRGRDPAGRLTDSIETAFEMGLGRCQVIVGDIVHHHVRGWRCAACGTDTLEPEPNLFRYNSSLGACPVCEGLGQTMELDRDQIFPDRALTIRSGAIAPWSPPIYRRMLQELVGLADRCGIPVDEPLERLTDREVDRLLDGVAGSGFSGLRAFFKDLERQSFTPGLRNFLNQWRRYQPCPGCLGARLRPEALAVKIGGRDIAALSALTAGETRDFLAGLDDLRRQPGATTILARVESRLGYLSEMGLADLRLDRPARTLSAGELKRVGLTKILGSGLVNTLYVLDEPSLGLHPHDMDPLIRIIKRIRDDGNTLVIVEHDDALIRASDHVIDLGPGPGATGGRVVYAGAVPGLAAVEGSATADYLFGRKTIAPPPRRRPLSQRSIRLIGASGNNLRSIDVTFPLGVLVAVSGKSGSGKSTLIEQTLYPALLHRIAADPDVAASYKTLELDGEIARVVFLDQSPLVQSARSNPATHLKAFDEIRRTFAATHEATLRNYDAGRFSFNVDGGRCHACKGNGYKKIDMQFLPDVMVRCPECLGKRYRPEVLEVTYRAKNIAEVLELTGREAFGFFRNRPRIQARLRPLLDIGLDYLRLGQPVSTLSGGEAQRLKLAGFLARSTAELKRPGKPPQTIFLLDEPTAGLHPLDIRKMLDTLNSLVDRGHSVIAIDHSRALLIAADWIVDLGPGAGHHGGRLVAQGTPEDVARAGSATGQVLAEILKQSSAAH